MKVIKERGTGRFLQRLYMGSIWILLILIVLKAVFIGL